MAQKKRTPQDEARDIREMGRGPVDEDRLRQALQSAHAAVVASAAHVVKELQLSGFSAPLADSFERFRRLPAKSDPGCVAKLALVEALDFTDHPDAAPFLAAARLVQQEPVWGGASDSAGPVRALAILALANLGYPDIVLLAGELLADAEASVRLAAADALAHSGARAGAGLLLMKLAGRDEPAVVLSCLSGMLALAPDWAMPRLREHLEAPDAELRELAAAALGQSSREDALDLLLELVESLPIASERAVLLRAVAMHRSDRAFEALLGIIAEGRAVDAAAAIRGLRARRDDTRLASRVRAAVERRSEPQVDEAFRATFARAQFESA